MIKCLILFGLILRPIRASRSERTRASALPAARTSLLKLFSPAQIRIILRSLPESILTK
jgi:hypothetical protein